MLAESRICHYTPSTRSFPIGRHRLRKSQGGAPVMLQTPSKEEFPVFPASWYLFCSSRALRAGPVSRDVVGRCFWPRSITWFRSQARRSIGEAQGSLLSPKWWLDPEGRGDVVFRPKKMSPAELQEACLAARRRFYSWSSIFARMLDARANARNLFVLSIYLGLNLGAHFDIDLRKGLQLGAGLSAWAALQ